MQKQGGNVLTACCKVGLITPVTTRTHTRRCGSPVNPGSYLLQAIYMAPVPDCPCFASNQFSSRSISSLCDSILLFIISARSQIEYCQSLLSGNQSSGIKALIKCSENRSSALKSFASTLSPKSCPSTLCMSYKTNPASRAIRLMSSLVI